MEEMLEVHTTTRDGVPIVSAQGEIDVSTAPKLRDELSSVSADSVRVVVDLSEVTFLDSTGLGVLVASWKRYNEAGGTLELVITRPQIVKVLEVTGLSSVFTIHSSLGDALAA